MTIRNTYKEDSVRLREERQLSDHIWFVPYAVKILHCTKSPDYVALLTNITCRGAFGGYYFGHVPLDYFNDRFYEMCKEIIKQNKELNKILQE